jgi:hypothetical protein
MPQLVFAGDGVSRVWRALDGVISHARNLTNRLWTTDLT